VTIRSPSRCFQPEAIRGELGSQFKVPVKPTDFGPCQKSKHIETHQFGGLGSQVTTAIFHHQNPPQHCQDAVAMSEYLQQALLVLTSGYHMPGSISLVDIFYT